jgi:hypothetical protein
MTGENRQLVTYEPVEVQDYRKITNHPKDVHQSKKEYRRMPTCNRLDLQTLGSQSIMPKIFPNHCL